MRLRFLVVLSGLILLGAGCGSGKSVAIPAQQMNSESALSGTGKPLFSGAQNGGAPQAPPVQRAPSFEVLPEEMIMGKQIRINTEKGEIVFGLLAEEAPIATSNFVSLASAGFYDGLTFHRVESGFVIQGGDPAGNGTGGPGYHFPDEPVTLDYLAGTVAMANAGPDTNGSQFFIVLDDQPNLPKNYTIFGRVLSGMDTVRSIRVGDVMSTVTVEDMK